MSITRSTRLRFAALPGRASADPLDGVGAASSVRIVRLHRTKGRRAHVHPRSEEIMYVIAGTATVWIDGVRERVRAGDVVHVPAGAAHATVPDADTDVELVCFFPDPDLASNLAETGHAVDTEGPSS